jgi:hypothetical protein
MWGNQQVGMAVIGGVERASMWSGTGATWVELHPDGASGSVALATDGTHQVGWANVGGVQRACLWTGTANSYEDLAVALQGDWSESVARGIWSDGTTVFITGYGFNDDTSQYEAILWTRPVSSDRVLTYSTQARGPSAGESLAVEYLSSTNQWVNLQTVTSTGAFENTFTPRSVAIPTGATVRHPKFAVRFRAVGNSTSDNWYIDDVRIGLPIPSCPADFNADTSIDFFDYLDFVAAFSSNDPAADFNADTSIDFFDYLDFVAAFSSPC